MLVASGHMDMIRPGHHGFGGYVPNSGSMYGYGQSYGGHNYNHNGYRAQQFHNRHGMLGNGYYLRPHLYGPRTSIGNSPNYSYTNALYGPWMTDAYGYDMPPRFGNRRGSGTGLLNFSGEHGSPRRFQPHLSSWRARLPHIYGHYKRRRRQRAPLWHGTEMRGYPVPYGSWFDDEYSDDWEDFEDDIRYEPELHW